MDVIGTITRDHADELLEKLAVRLEVDSSTVIPFTDFTEMMTALLEHVGQKQTRLLIAGHASPDLALAVERAGLEAVVIPGASPFVMHPEDVIQEIDSPANLVYVANPNRVTGSDMSNNHLNRLAERVKDGVLIIDEKYFDYYGISGLPLLEKYDHVVLIRSLTAGFGIRSDESGCLIGSPHFISNFKNYYQWSRITTTMFRLLSTSLADESLSARRLTQVHDEALRLALQLTSLGLQNRITSADFLLLRVADPKKVAAFLTRFGSPVDDLSIYPDLTDYLSYRIQSPLSNDNFLSACKRMPLNYYRMPDIDKRAVMFHRPGEPGVGGQDDHRVTGNRLANRRLATITSEH
jgi:histidinol-phosphate/aromatic aminotransferase/cobyric acid decarboxylase-like protein